MGERQSDDIGAGELLARLEAMQERLDQQDAKIARQAAEIAQLKGTAMVPAPAPVGIVSTEPKVGRRGMLTKVLGATAAAAVLTVAKEAATAEATSRTTVVGSSTDGYGIAASVGAFDPATLIPNIGGVGFGVIGTFGSPGYAPPFSAGVLGQGSGAFYGVIGLSQNNPGVYGRSTGGQGLYGLSTSSFGVFGNSSQAVGIFGLAQGAAGIYGLSSNSVGVFGEASQNAGVYGKSPVYGVWGQATTGWGVYGEGTGNGGIGVFGRGGPNGFAGYFNGNVYVTGQLFVNGVPVSGPSAQGTTRSAETQATPAVIEPKDIKPPAAPTPPKTEGPRRERPGGPDAP